MEVRNDRSSHGPLSRDTNPNTLLREFSVNTSEESDKEYTLISGVS